MTGKIQWKGESASQTNSTSPRYSDHYDRSSYDSSQSQSTAKTEYSVRRPALSRKEKTCLGRIESHETDYPFDTYEAPDAWRASIETYATTEPDDFEDSDDEGYAYEILDFPEEQYRSDAIPATPRDFSELFPSTRRLSIRHDDSTVDGNLNLLVSTQVETDWSSRKQDITLYHLKMNDLKSRDFSLRRYCRDSGREVCHAGRKYHSSPSEGRPTLTKSLSSALATFRRHSEPKSPHLKRSDSGYGSIFHERLDDLSVKSPNDVTSSSSVPTNTIKLEFSNYAQVEVKRKGSNSKKGYQFEYWGHTYTWRRNVRQEGTFEEVSFHLLRKDQPAPLAHIVPVPMTRFQAEEERSRGGFIPACSMWIKDASIVEGLPDLAE